MIHGNMPLLYGMTSVILETCQQYTLLIIGIMGCIESSINTYFNIFQNDRLSHNAAFAIALFASCLALSVNYAARVAMTEKELVSHSFYYYNLILFLKKKYIYLFINDK